MGDTLLFYSQGFPVGKKGANDKYYVNNHVHMVVDYHPMVLGDVSRLEHCRTPAVRHCLSSVSCCTSKSGYNQLQG